MTDSVDAENAYEQSQQEMEAGEVEIVDSGRVIDELDEALMQMGDTGEGSEQHEEYGGAVAEHEKQGDTGQQDTGIHMSVSEEVIVETEESNPAMAPAPGSDGGDMEECISEETGLYSDDEDDSDLFADRDVDQIIRDPVTGELNEYSYTKWRCANGGCLGALRTSPGLTELRCSGQQHVAVCKPDDLRVRLRIVIYDLRLMAEFTDDPLEDLYSHFVDKLAAENPDVLALFPPLEALVKRLTKHREYKIYRRRFEYEKIMSERRRGQHPKDFAPAMVRRQRPFPPSVCIECGISIVTDSDTTSQENFVDHVAQDHQREATCQYYSFHGVYLFEQWMRELQQRSRYKIRRFAMHNESLFFLCAADDRWCRAYGVNSDGLHCTAFVRVYDYRRVSRQEIQVLRIQYCLDHNFHSDEDVTIDPPFTPDVFMHEVEERRLRTADLVKSHAQRARLVRRRGEMGSEIMPETGAWTEEGVREDESNLQEPGAFASEPIKRPPPVTRTRDAEAAEVGDFNEGPDTEHAEQDEGAAAPTAVDVGERNVDYGIEGNEEGQELQVEGESAAGKLKRVSLQKPRIMGSRFAQMHGGQQFPGSKSVKSEYDEKREVANLVDQCNRRISESRSTRSGGPESRDISGGSAGAGGAQPHYVTHRSNFASYTLYNLVMQIELQCELFKERAQSLKHIGAAKKYLKYLTSLCDNLASDPECNKTAEEMAAEMFDLKEISSSGIVVTKQVGNLPILNFGSVDESGTSSAQQREGKSESETQPLIFLPVVPARSTPEESVAEKTVVDEEAEMDTTEETQHNLRRSKRGRGKDEADTSPEVKKGRGKAAGTATPKVEAVGREPYQTRRSRGVVKPNTKGVFDKSTYVGEGEEATSTTEGDESSKSPESRGGYTLRRLPFGAQTSKLKIAGRTMQLGADSEELSGKPMTLRTAAGNLVTVMRRLDGRLVMVTPQVLSQKESRAPVVEETPRETRSRAARSAASGKKTPKQEQQIREDEEPKETKSQRALRAERRSVHSKYPKKDKDRRDEKSADSSTPQKAKEKEADTEKTNPEEAESSKDETEKHETESSSKRITRKQLSENDVIVMDDETFLAVVDDMSLGSPIQRAPESESRRLRGKKKDTEEESAAADAASGSRREEVKT